MYVFLAVRPAVPTTHTNKCEQIVNEFEIGMSNKLIIELSFMEETINLGK